MTRLELFDKIFPFCEQNQICLQHAAPPGFGWIYDPETVKKVITAWKEGTLESYNFETKNKNGKYYQISSPTRLGVVAHRNNQVGFFVIDLDDHDKVKNTRFAEALPRFFQTNPIFFTSKSSKGIHQFYFLENSVPVKDFLDWARSWGFNRPGRPELFPKGEKLSQLWLPNDPNEKGGDCNVV